MVPKTFPNNDQKCDFVYYSDHIGGILDYLSLDQHARGLPQIMTTTSKFSIKL